MIGKINKAMNGKNVASQMTGASKNKIQKTFQSRVTAKSKIGNPQPPARQQSLPQGSMAGHKGARTARVNMNGKGYMDPSVQRARYGGKGRAVSAPRSVPSGNPIGRRDTINKNVFDYTYTSSPGSSMDRMNKLRRL